MEKNVAVSKFNYLKPNPIFIVHQNIVEINAEETAAAMKFNKKHNADCRPGFLKLDTKRQSRTFKCLDCGRVWTDNINAPLVMSQSELNHFYPQAKSCSILK